MKAYTDYPFYFLGDEPHEEAPVRECHVKSYDGNKYCTIVIDGNETEIKAGYIYTKPGRCGYVPTINVKKLRA